MPAFQALVSIWLAGRCRVTTAGSLWGGPGCPPRWQQQVLLVSVVWSLDHATRSLVRLGNSDLVTNSASYHRHYTY